MAKKEAKKDKAEIQPIHDAIPDEAHPDYVAGAIGDGEPAEAYAPELSDSPQAAWSSPVLCAPVSGRYVVHQGAASKRLPSITVRVDVDRYFPQDRISIAVTRFLGGTAHAIAEVASDQCLRFNNRRIEATITYRDGDPSLIPGDQVVFEARRGRRVDYDKYTLTLSRAGVRPRTYSLAFQSRQFDSVEFEIDQVENAGEVVTSYDIGSHPTRPADLVTETVSLATVYQRAGFAVSMSPNATSIPIADAGANGSWSDSEMHNAMVAYWSRFADRPQWAMWVLYALQHDQGRSLGGIMFDDIGPNHRQGTAIFTDSFIQDAPPGDDNPGPWRARMAYWTAVHEMGHAFNLAHAWQKALGTPQGAPGDPWIPLANEPESRSFMNYPFRVSGGQASFFSDFRFRFSDDELIFMRHAPRRFVQMGNSDWFVDHAFEAPDQLTAPGNWTLEIRPNRDVNTYRFLEPVAVEFKLTRTSAGVGTVEEHLLTEGHNLTVLVQRVGGRARLWRPMVTRCHKEDESILKPSESLYASHTISASPEGWLIDEPGTYQVQGAIDLGDDVVVSNVLRLSVAPPITADEAALAPQYFTEEVARALVFGGAPSLSEAMATLEEVS